MHMNKHHENGGSRPTRTAAKRIGRVFLPICLLVLIAGAAVGGTMAYIANVTSPVVNTFSVGDIKITLTETEYEYKDGKDVYGETAEGVNNSYPMIPGKEYDKDPVVTVLGSEKSVEAYLFVEVTEAMNSGLVYTLNWEDGWTKLEDGVYYRVVPASTEDQPFHLIKGDKVKVDPDVINKKAMPAANSTLTFTAYAIQTENLEPAAAWAAVKNP